MAAHKFVKCVENPTKCDVCGLTRNAKQHRAEVLLQLGGRMMDAGCTPAAIEVPEENLPETVVTVTTREDALDAIRQILDAPLPRNRKPKGWDTDTRKSNGLLPRNTAKRQREAEALQKPLKAAVPSEAQKETQRQYAAATAALGGTQSITLTKRITERGGLTSYARPGVRSSVYTTPGFFCGLPAESFTITAPAGTFVEPKAEEL